MDRAGAGGDPLADTELFIEVDHDFTAGGDEVKFGGSEVIQK